MEDFIKKVLEDAETFGDFTITKYSKSKFDDEKKNIWYGESKDRTGMTVINWCTKGHYCTYFGEKVDPNISVSVSKDGGTRYVFNGYCFNEKDFRKILKLTW